MAGRKKTATMELAIGATIIAGVIILIVMLMAWGNTTSILGRHYRIIVNMTNVGGLKEGAPVKLGGLQIGRVSTIQIRPGGTDMELVLDIDEDRLLPRDSTAKVSTAGLVGDAFMEIIPGKSAEMVKRSTTVAEAQHIESSPLPDLSELMVKVNEFGDQLTILTTNLNDIVGDAQFRKNVKSLVTNIDGVAYQANLILQRGQGVIDNLELASNNVAELSTTLKASVEEITADVEKVTDKAIEIADTAKETIGTVKEAADIAKTTIEKTSTTIENIDGGVTEARQALANTIGNPKFAEDLTKTIGNINAVTAALAKRKDAIDSLLVNVDALTADLRVISGHVKAITGEIDPATIPTTITAITSALNSLTDVVEKIKKDPVLALSMNKAADRIVKMKFDEMSKQPHMRNSDAVLAEIRRWLQESMKRGFMDDPAYTPNKRPYMMER